MAQSDRRYGTDLVSLNIAGYGFASFFASCKPSFTFDTQEAKAVKDRDHFERGVCRGRTIDITHVEEAGQGNLFVLANQGLSVDFSINTGTHVYAGTGIFRTADHSIPDGPQEVSGQITVQGVFYIDGVAQ